MKKEFIFLCLPIVFACEKEITAKLPEFEPKLVANSYIQPDTSVYVFLTNNVNILSNDIPESITDAEIQLFENDILIDVLQETTLIPEYPLYGIEELKGVYFSEVKPKEGANYTIHINHSNYPIAIGSTEVPNQTSSFNVELSEPTFSYSEDEEGATEEPRSIGYNAKIEIQDAPGKNYYEIAVFSKHLDLIGFNGPEPVLEFYHLDNGFKSDNLIFELENEDEFRGDAGEVFNDGLFDNQTYTFDISFEVWLNGSSFQEEYDLGLKEVIIQVRSLSYDYYQYLLTSKLQKGILQDPFAEPVQIYSNIQNGIGIFGGYNFQTFSFDPPDF